MRNDNWTNFCIQENVTKSKGKKVRMSALGCDNDRMKHAVHEYSGVKALINDQIE